MIKVLKYSLILYLLIATAHNIYLWEFKYTTSQEILEDSYLKNNNPEIESKIAAYIMTYLLDLLLFLIFFIISFLLLILILDGNFDKFDEWDKPKKQRLKEKYYKKYKK